MTTASPRKGSDPKGADTEWTTGSGASVAQVPELVPEVEHANRSRRESLYRDFTRRCLDRSHGGGEGAPRGDLNPRPAHHESAALPLSYPGLGRSASRLNYFTLSLSIIGCRGVSDFAESRFITKTPCLRTWGHEVIDRSPRARDRSESWSRTRPSY